MLEQDTSEKGGRVWGDERDCAVGGSSGKGGESMVVVEEGKW